MKAGVAAALIACREAGRLGLAGDVVVATVADEEHASLGVQEVLETVRADAAVVTEPTELEIGVAHKGFVWMEIEVTGRAAHGSRPQLGVDAIVKAGPILTALGELDLALGARTHPLVGRASIHSSMIEGGVELSSYPARCVIGIERRTVPGETVADVEREIESLLDRCRSADAALEVQRRTLLHREPFEVDPGLEIVTTVLATAQQHGVSPPLIGASYWADSGFISAAGIPTVLFGPGGEGVRPDAPAGFERVLERALAKNPAQRFSTITQFCEALTHARSEPNRPFTATTRTIAVLPFVNSSPDPDNEYLSDGITDELINALAKVEGLRVASRTSVFALKGKAQDVRAIGALLEASEVLEGSVRRSGENLRITVQLTSTDDGRLMWSERYDRRLIDVFAIQDEIARTIVTTLRSTSFADIAPTPTNRHTENVLAYGLYLRGRYAWNKRTSEGVFEGIKYFEQAIALDPTYALAYTGLADSYSLHIDYRNVAVHEGHQKAKLYARKAIELDDTLAEAHASLAWSSFIYDWDWDGAVKEFRRAIELDPRYAPAHQWYAFMLASQGNFDEALLEGHTAQENDPSSVSVRRSLGYAYFYARKYDQAHYHLDRAIAMNPTAEESFRIQGLILTFQKQFPAAERVLREALALAPECGSSTKATLAYSLAAAGDPSYARQVAAELEERLKVEYVSPVEQAIVHIALGDRQKALDWTERAIDERRGWVAYLRVHPIVDSLRGEPRFDALVQRMKFGAPAA